VFWSGQQYKKWPETMEIAVATPETQQAAAGTTTATVQVSNADPGTAATETESESYRVSQPPAQLQSELEREPPAAL
jgi:hypothetical protein